MENMVGKTIANRYRVDAFIGRGGMAEVYKVWDIQRAAFLAMKVLREDLAEDKVFLRRFRREGQTLSALQHPNIVRYYGLEESSGLVFMLMDFIEGTSLRKMIATANRPFTLHRAIDILRPVCSALFYAHQAGVIHCDVKPANILIDRSGRIFISDFGIAQIAGGATTATMVGAGTPAYMAPEQIRGQALSPQTDIYSLGIVLYEMLTAGERPFTGELAPIDGSTAEKVCWEHLNSPVTFPQDIAQAIPGAAKEVVTRCLQKNVNQRYTDASAILQDLERIAFQQGGPAATAQAAQGMESSQMQAVKPISAQSPAPVSSSRAEAPRKPQNRPGMLVVGFGIIIILLVFMMVRLWGRQEPASSTAASSKTALLAYETLAPPAATPTQAPSIAPPPATLAPTVTLSATPAPTSPPQPRIGNFSICTSPCNGSNATRTFPERVEEIYLQFDYADFPAGAHYIRTWRMKGKGEWVRYDCTWNGPASGRETSIKLWDREGLTSGVWEVSIEINNQVILREQVTIEGNNSKWTPAGTFDTCYGKR